MTKKPVIITISFLAIILLACIAVYSNSLGGRFLWDDHYLVSANRYLASWNGLGKLFVSDIGAGSGVSYGFYRPLQMVSYFADHALWHKYAFGYHLTSIILHALVAIAVFFFVSVLFKDRLLAFLTALLYAVHPIHTEAVAYISGRTDPLAVFFLLSAFICYVIFAEGRGRYYFVFTAVLYALALLSREQSLIFPALVIVYHLSFRKKMDLRPFAALLLVSFLYVMARVWVLGFALHHAVKGSSFIDRLPGAFAAIAEYFRLLFIPAGIHMAYGHVTFYFSDPRVIAGILVTGLLVSMAVRGFERGDRITLFSVLWFLTALLPVLNIFPRLNAYMAVHWLYLPSIGFFILLSNYIRRLYLDPSRRKLAVAVFGVLVVYYSFLTMEQNSYWSDPVRFFERTARYAPEDYKWKAYYHLANEYADSGMTDKAMRLYRQSIALNGSFAECYYRFGVSSHKAGDTRKAIFLLRKAIWADPSYEPAYRALSRILRQQGDTTRANQYLSIADRLSN